MNYSAAFELVVLKMLCINEQYAIKVSAMKKCGIIFFAKPATKQFPLPPLSSVSFFLSFFTTS